MADIIPDRSALDGVYREGTYGAERAGGPAVTLAERTGRTLIHLSGDVDGAGFPTAARHAFDLPLPLNAGETRDGGATRLIWLGPDAWLAACEDAPDLSGLEGLAAVNDVTQGRLVVRVSGPDSRVMLCKGCPLDLHPSAFPAGHAAQTLVGHVTALVDCVADDTFEVYVTRSYARYFWDWLTGQAAEFGYRVAAA